jgi:DNA-binding beta-propeller fold protein YncE
VKPITAVKLLALLALLWPRPAAGESMVEVWRSPFGRPYAVAVDPSDGSCWATTGGSVIHVSRGGKLLAQINGLPTESLAVNPRDGSCWVGGRVSSGWSLVHLSRHGKVLRRVSGLDVGCLTGAAVNPADGSCWVTTEITGGHAELIHLSSDGATRLLLRGGFGSLTYVAVSPADGSVWAADAAAGALVHITADGRKVWGITGFAGVQSVSVNPRDGSRLVAMGKHDGGPGRLVRVAANRRELWRRDFGYLGPVSASSADGSFWVVPAPSTLARLGADGKEVVRVGGFHSLDQVAVDPEDGSCWVADGGGLVHVAADGRRRWQSGGFRNPVSVSAYPKDGSCWVADQAAAEVVHLARSEKTLWRGGSFRSPCSVSVNPRDGSCYVADSQGKQVARLAADGSELWRKEGFTAPSSITVNPRDGSCWVGDGGDLLHLSADGAELWRGASVGSCAGLNPTDGSCWVVYGEPLVDEPVSHERSDLAHLSADGRQLWRVAEDGWYAGFGPVSVNPADGSCWVGWVERRRDVAEHDSKVIHFAADGTRLWQASGFDPPVRLAVSPDGSCWVTTEEQLVHLSAAGKELSRSPVVGDEIVAPDPTHKSLWAARPGAGVVLRLEAREAARKLR